MYTQVYIYIYTERERERQRQRQRQRQRESQRERARERERARARESERERERDRERVSMVGVRNEQLTFLAVHIVADADQQPWSCRGRLLSKEPNFTDKPNTMTSRAVGDAATSDVL